MVLIQQFKSNRKRLAASVIVLGLCAVVIWLFTRPDSDALKVPLGVEQAAIVTYSGPRLEVAPYKWGVAVNVRIADEIEKADRRIYDIRYIVNRPGTFNLKDYLVAEDGSELAALPDFSFTGDPQLSKDLDTRIQETEEVTINVGGRYYEWMTFLALLWIGWLFLLIFYKRKKPVLQTDESAHSISLPEQLSTYLKLIEAGRMDTAMRAGLEMTLIRFWRDELSLEEQSMDQSLKQIGKDKKIGTHFRRLQDWLHNPSPKVSDSEIIELLKPFSAEVAS